MKNVLIITIVLIINSCSTSINKKKDFLGSVKSITENAYFLSDSLGNYVKNKKFKTSKFIYSENGELLEHNKYGRDGLLISKKLNIYNEKGKLEERNYFENKEITNKGIYVYHSNDYEEYDYEWHEGDIETYQYLDKYGNLVEKVDYELKGLEEKVVEYNHHLDKKFPIVVKIYENYKNWYSYERFIDNKNIPLQFMSVDEVTGERFAHRESGYVSERRFEVDTVINGEKWGNWKCMIVKEEYSYSENSVEIKFSNAIGYCMDEYGWVVKVDEFGRETSQKPEKVDSLSFDFAFIDKLIFDENQNLIRAESNNKYNEATVYEYDKYGNLIMEKSSQKIKKSVYKYDEKGNWIERADFFNGSPTFIWTREYDYFD